MIGALLAGQSLAANMFITSDSPPTPHADTHMWNGSAWVAPTGNGAITYCNKLRELRGEPVYVINAAVGGAALLALCTPISGFYWLNTASGSLFNNAVAQVQAALAATCGLSLDRIEWWQGQQECFYWQAYGTNMTATYLDGLGTLVGMFRAVFTNNFQFAVWPVGRLSTGHSQNVVRAQMTFSNSFADHIEPGPSSHDQNTSDGTHLSAAVCGVMGYRGALNAASSLAARDAGTLTAAAHGGAGPRITGITRSASLLLLDIAVKPGLYLQPSNFWGIGDVNITSDWGVWSADLSTNYSAVVRLVGSKVRVEATATLPGPARVGFASAQDWAGTSLYDSAAQVMLPIDPTMLVSN